MLQEIPQLSNKALEDFMDRLADCGESKILSQFDNFIVSEFPESEPLSDFIALLSSKLP